MTRIIEPVIHQAAPAIGNRLAIVSAILGFVTLALWATLQIIKKRQDKAELLAPSEQQPLAQSRASQATASPSRSAAQTAPQPRPEPANLPENERK